MLGPCGRLYYLGMLVDLGSKDVNFCWIEIMPQVPKGMWHESMKATQGSFFFCFRITGHGSLLEVRRKLEPSYL
jgi:hypothetical protein